MNAPRSSSWLSRLLGAGRTALPEPTEAAVELELSGAHWCARFPTGRDTSSLVQPFRKQVQDFITALEAADIQVRISATRRPIERAWLMFWAWKVFHHEVRPEDVPAREGLPIQWVHGDSTASWAACRDMVKAYELVHRPSLTSRHIEGRAVDMSVTGWEGEQVVSANGERVTLHRAADLYALGATYGVHKLVSDPPHWSDDGR